MTAPKVAWVEINESVACQWPIGMHWWRSTLLEATSLASGRSRGYTESNRYMYFSLHVFRNQSYSNAHPSSTISTVTGIVHATTCVSTCEQSLTPTMRNVR